MGKEISTYIHDGMELPIEDWSNAVPEFNDLADTIQRTHDAAQSSAVKAINRMQTMRNWLIGYYIVEFEQHGKDRAEYGAQLLKKLEAKVNRRGVTVTLFKWARKFYRLYPQMGDNLTHAISPSQSDLLLKQNGASVSHQLQIADYTHDGKSASLMHQFVTPGNKVLSHLSFTHLREIMTVDV